MQLTITRVNIRDCRHAIHLVERNRNVIIANSHLYKNRGIGVFYDAVNLHQSNITGCHISYCYGGGVVTRGGEGSNIYTGGTRIDIPCAKPAQLRDPTGCGDAYRAGLLYGLMNGLDWATTGRIASLIGAIKIEHAGTQNHRFTREEFAQRQKNACKKMAEQGLDGLVMFRQESMYYLTGYDTMGFTMFQALYMGADGRIALLTRTADRLQSRATSIIDDIRIWYDRAGATPGEDLKKMLEDYGCKGKRLGIEYHAYGLTAQRGKMVDAALEGFCTTVDASDLVRLLRLVKSPKELEYTRKAGAICDLIHKVSLEHVKPGVSTKAIFGKMMEAQMAAGGDPAASRWPFGGG